MSRNAKPRFSIIHITLFLLVLSLLILYLSLFSGRYPEPGLIAPWKLIGDPMACKIVWALRLPRIITALLAGSVLASAGFVFQMIFGNPLIEPGFLGVSQGAAFGAAAAIILNVSALWIIQITAGAGAFLGLFLTLLFARHMHYGGWILRMILAGITSAALLSSGIGMLKYIADPMDQLQDITFWMLGGMSHIGWRHVTYLLPFSIVILLIIFFYRWRLQIISLGDRTAFSSGIHIRLERALLLSCATIGTAAVISVTGLIGWVGLIVPHLGRRLCGSSVRSAIPVSMVIGANYMLVSDTLSRSLYTGELPLGVLTSLFGAVLFILLLTSRGRLGKAI